MHVRSVENLRLKREVSALEKKNKELLKLNHDLMTKNNSLNQEILYFKYSNKESNYKQPTNTNNYTIIELNRTISELKQKINQITQEKNDLLKNNTLSKTLSISHNASTIFQVFVAKLVPLFIYKLFVLA